MTENMYNNSTNYCNNNNDKYCEEDIDKIMCHPTCRATCNSFVCRAQAHYSRGIHSNTALVNLSLSNPKSKYIIIH